MGEEMLLVLEKGAEAGRIAPRLFRLGEGPFVLVLDLEERLTELAAGRAPYAAMPGRRIAQMLAGQQIGLGINLGTAPSEMLLPAEAVEWLADRVSQRPQETEDQIIEIAPPRDLPEVLLAGLDTKLRAASGLAPMAWLCAVTYAGGRRGHLLAFVDNAPGSGPALAQVVGEALAFSGLETGDLDVSFVSGDAPLTARLAKWGLRIDLPAPLVQETRPARKAPGSDPTKPPILR